MIEIYLIKIDKYSNKKKQYIYKSLLQTLINEQANFELDDLDQKVIFAMAEYFYDNPKAKNDLLKYANSNEDFNIKMTLKDLNTFINNWDEELHGKF